jgi:dinuclear metal center YbgI/SA1388 family protein
MSGHVSIETLTAYLNEYLGVAVVQDYCPNGLQVEGFSEIRKLATAVTASQAAIEQAIEWGADALLVHHGFFWRNEPAPLVGIKGKRIQTAMQADLNILAYHLPLDMHSQVGNNAQLAQLLNIVDDQFDPKRVWRAGHLDFSLPLDGFAERIRRTMRRDPLVISGGDHPVSHIAWCSGAGQGYFAEAIAAGVDTFLTGEVSESNYHLAKEAGVHFIAAGHHATERLGVQALAEHLVFRYALDHRYIELDNPV